MSRSPSKRLKRGLKTTSRQGLRFNFFLKQLFGKKGKTIFISALPKSGSTFLVNALAEVTNFETFFLGYNHLNEQDLYVPNLIDAWSMDVISHQHTRPSQPNISLMRQFKINPIILTRSVFDAVVSLTDHLEQESQKTPLLNVPIDFLERHRTERLDMVIDLALPWYFRFVADWSEAQNNAMPDCLWISYEELISDGVSIISKILTFHGLTSDDKTIKRALQKVRNNNSRLNKGVAGRGDLELNVMQKSRIRSLTRHYPKVDFSCLDLPRVQ